jgi:hypothetical protein
MAGAKRVETRARNQANVQAPAPRAMAPQLQGTPLSQRSRMPSSNAGPSPAGYSTSPPQTPCLPLSSIPAATPNPNAPGLEKSLPPMPRIPLQPVNVNTGASYIDFSLLGHPTPVARPLAPSIPPAASENELEWFTSLSSSQQAALLSSCRLKYFICIGHF